MDKLLERFLQYVSLDTQSKAGVRQVPSTEGQWKLLRLLQAQLEEMGLVNVTLSEKGTVMGTLAANVAGDIPPIGFISHVDTAPDFSGKHVSPQIVENYRGGDIALGIGDEVLSPVMFPVLHQLLSSVGQLSPGGLWLTAIGLSQFISNVPATILLLNYVPPSTLLAWAVNVGGFGLLPGSLANLIALRMAADRRIWWRFHLYSLPMLLWAALVGYAILHFGF